MSGYILEVMCCKLTLCGAGFSKSGENKGGLNVLNFDGSGMTEAEQWLINKKWLDDAINRNDIIRSISNPFDNKNLYKRNDVGEYLDNLGNIIPESDLYDKGARTFYGKEKEYLQNSGYIYNATNALWYKP